MKINIKQQVLETIGFFIVFAVALFLPAGTLAWTAGWIFLLLFFGFYIAVTSWLYRHNPGLMQERTRLATSDQQGWDKNSLSNNGNLFRRVVNFHITGRGSLSLVAGTILVASDWDANPLVFFLFLVFDL